jgi:hypothetical protein
MRRASVPRITRRRIAAGAIAAEITAGGLLLMVRDGRLGVPGPGSLEAPPSGEAFESVIGLAQGPVGHPIFPAAPSTFFLQPIDTSSPEPFPALPLPARNIRGNRSPGSSVALATRADGDVLPAIGPPSGRPKPGLAPGNNRAARHFPTPSAPEPAARSGRPPAPQPPNRQPGGSAKAAGPGAPPHPSRG